MKDTTASYDYSEPWTLPPKQGLYDPILEREACGVGFIVAIDGKRSHKVRPDFKLRRPSVAFKCKAQRMNLSYT